MPDQFSPDYPLVYFVDTVMSTSMHNSIDDKLIILTIELKNNLISSENYILKILMSNKLLF